MNEENYIVFDKYLQEKLTPDEKILFEKQLSDDPELALTLETFKEVQLHLQNKFGIETERNAFKKNLKTISKEHFKSQKPKIINFRPITYLVAASVVLLLGLFVFDMNSNPKFDDFNQQETAYFTERGETIPNLKQAETAFNTKKYAEAIPIFEVILKENKTPEIYYFYGISLLETNKIHQAEVIFNELKSGNSIYKNKASWSLALSKLKQKDYKSCKEILLTIPSDYENYDEVQELLKKLD